MAGDGTALCTECARMVTGTPKVDFLGFPTFLCPACRDHAKHPLSVGRWIFYALVGGAAATFAIMRMVQHGGAPFPGAIALAMLVAIGMDVKVRRRFRWAKARAAAAAADAALAPPVVAKPLAP